MRCQGGRAMSAGFTLILFAVSVGISFGGLGLLLGLLGVLAGVNLIAVAVRTIDSPTGISLLTPRRRGSPAVVGLVVASCSITALIGDTSSAICFGLFATFLLGILLVTVGVLACSPSWFDGVSCRSSGDGGSGLGAGAGRGQSRHAGLPCRRAPSSKSGACRYRAGGGGGAQPPHGILIVSGDWETAAATFNDTI